MDWRASVYERNVSRKHKESAAYGVGRDDPGVVRLQEVLVEQHPEERDAEGEYDEEVACKGRASGYGVPRAAGGNERCACSGDEEREPADAVHAFVGKDGGADSEDDRHGADHERGMGHGGERKAFELHEELDRYAEKCAEQHQHPVAARHLYSMQEQNGKKCECGKEKPVEHHVAYAHLCQGDLSEEKTCAPKRACSGACAETQEPVIVPRCHLFHCRTPAVVWPMRYAMMEIRFVRGGIPMELFRYLQYRPAACFFAHAAMVLLALPAMGADKKPVAAGPVPAMQFDMRSYGFQRISMRVLASGRSLISVNFAGPDKLLVSFATRKLMKRDPNQTEDEHDHEVHAVLLQLPSGKLLAETDWRLHDDGPYLWPISNGRFLLRERSRMRMLDPVRAQPGAELLSTPVFEASNGQKLFFVDVTADGNMVELQTKRGHLIGDDLDLQGDPDVKRSNKTLVRFYAIDPVANELHLKGRAETDKLFGPPYNADGFLGVSQDDGTHWGFDFHFFKAGNDKELAGLETSCAPDAIFLSATRFLASACRGGIVHNMMGVLDLSGHVLWLNRRSSALWPALYSAPAAGRFAVRRTQTEAADTSVPGEADGAAFSQDVSVLRTATGEELFKVNIIPPIRTMQNFALSADGLQLVVWNDDTVEVYNLPPLTKKDKDDSEVTEGSGVVLVPGKP